MPIKFHGVLLVEGRKPLGTHKATYLVRALVHEHVILVVCPCRHRVTAVISFPLSIIFHLNSLLSYRTVRSPTASNGKLTNTPGKDSRSTLPARATRVVRHRKMVFGIRRCTRRGMHHVSRGFSYSQFVLLRFGRHWNANAMLLQFRGTRSSLLR